MKKAKPVVINYDYEICFNHNTWENIHKFAESGAVVKNLTLYNTVNRVEIAKIFWDLVKNLPNLQLTEKDILDFFNQKGIVVFAAELDGNIVGMMVFDLDIQWHSSLCQTLEATYWLAGYKESTAPLSYGLMYEAIQFFRQIGCDYLNLGCGENYNISAEDLLDWKSGWVGKSKKEFKLNGI